MVDQTWVQDQEFTLTPVVVNGVTINGSYRLQNGRYYVTVSSTGRSAEMTFSTSVYIPTQAAADTVAHALVDAAHGAASSLPASP